MALSSKNKQKLKGLAHSLKPTIIIGKDGLSDGTIASINIALESRELIKIKFNSHREEKTYLSEKIETLCEASLVGSIGNILIIFKQNEDKEKRKINI